MLWPIAPAERASRPEKNLSLRRREKKIHSSFCVLHFPVNPFTLLGLTRRPLLTEEEIGTAYRKLAGVLHPDQATGEASAFRGLGEAKAILSDPARRLRELAGVHSECQIPEQAAEFFPQIALLLQRSDILLEKHFLALNPLSKALLSAPLRSLVEDLSAILSSLNSWKASLDQELVGLDAAWPDVSGETLNQLADSFAYASKWESQLRERKLALESILG
jgi:curved DNA-binding protein CbpA